jgi:hypothetical protein
MHMIAVSDEQVYRRLMAAADGGSIDEALRAVLPETDVSQLVQAAPDGLTPEQRLLHILETEPLDFDSEFTASESDDIIYTEAGKITWRDEDK